MLKVALKLLSQAKISLNQNNDSFIEQYIYELGLKESELLYKIGETNLARAKLENILSELRPTNQVH